ncbi:MAG: hypothetical protein AAB930_03935, partial [Patescibacteria group bacterium]
MARPKIKIENSLTRNSYLKGAVLNILENIGEAAFMFIDEGLLNPAYSFTGPGRALLGLSQRHDQVTKYRRKEVKLRRNLIAVTMWRLQKEGLVFRTGAKRNFKWKIIEFGKRYTKERRLDNHNFELPPRDGKIRIVSFDIPEKERQKRARLRELLGACDYSLLQRSLWIGRRPLPQVVFEQIK